MVLFGVAVVGAGASTFFAVRTVGAHDDFDRTPTTATRDGFYRERLATNVALGVTAVAVGVGVTLWVLAPREERRTGWLRPEGIVF
jgi:hypothetical protein